jgi:hypothetical protein
VGGAGDHAHPHLTIPLEVFVDKKFRRIDAGQVLCSIPERPGYRQDPFSLSLLPRVQKVVSARHELADGCWLRT